MDAACQYAPQCRRVAAAAIYDLRMRVIIAGTDRDTVVFEGDDAPDTIHYGWYAPNLVCCASLMMSSWDGESAYQLRGMATEPPLQGKGYGACLLHGIESDIAANEPVRILWCNAREHAAGFYEKGGWIRAGEPFDIPGVGPHQKLFKQLA